jgi:hypothetical protein
MLAHRYPTGAHRCLRHDTSVAHCNASTENRDASEADHGTSIIILQYIDCGASHREHRRG